MAPPRRFPNSDKTRMCIPMVAIPEPSIGGTEGLHDQFDTRGSISHEDKVEELRVCIKVTERLQTDVLDTASRELRRGSGGVRVSVEIRQQVGGEALDELLGVECCAGVVKVGCACCSRVSFGTVSVGVISHVNEGYSCVRSSSTYALYSIKSILSSSRIERGVDIVISAVRDSEANKGESTTSTVVYQEESSRMERVHKQQPETTWGGHEKDASLGLTLWGCW